MNPINVFRQVNHLNTYNTSHTFNSISHVSLSFLLFTPTHLHIFCVSGFRTSLYHLVLPSSSLSSPLLIGRPSLATTRHFAFRRSPRVSPHFPSVASFHFSWAAGLLTACGDRRVQTKYEPISTLDLVKVYNIYPSLFSHSVPLFCSFLFCRLFVTLHLSVCSSSSG